MSRGKYVCLSIILLIAYAVGLPLFIIGVTGEDQLLLLVIGLLCCGLPTGVIFWVISKLFDTSRDIKILRRLAFFLIGLFLGLAVTPILIIWCIVKAAKSKAGDTSQTVSEESEQIPTDIPRP